MLLLRLGFLKWVLENSLLMFIKVLPTQGQLGIWSPALGTRLDWFLEEGASVQGVSERAGGRGGTPCGDPPRTRRQWRLYLRFTDDRILEPRPRSHTIAYVDIRMEA